MVDNSGLADFAIKYAMKKGASYAEARFEETEGSSFLLKNKQIEAAGFDKFSGIGIRIIADKAQGVTSTNILTKENIQKEIDATINAAKKAAKARYEKIILTEEKPNKEKYKVHQKISLLDTDVQEKIKNIIEVEKQISKLKINVSGLHLSYADQITEKLFINSEGTQIQSEIPRIGVFYYLTVQENGQTMQKFQQFGAAKGYEAMHEWAMPQRITEHVKLMHNNLSKGRKIKTKKPMDLVLGPEVVGIMVHESCGHPCEADRILGREAAQAGESFITPKMLGTRIGSNEVTIIDDPTLANSYGYFLYDDEGVKARVKYLYKNGLINEFLHNRQTAAAMQQEKSNGSARVVSYDKEPILRMSNTYFAPGKFTEEDLIEGVKNGIFMKTYMEWNIDDKRFNQKYTGSEAYLIENGKITAPVKEPVLEITTPQLWRSVDAAAKNLEFNAGSCGKGEPMQAIPVFFGGPSIRLRGVKLK